MSPHDNLNMEATQACGVVLELLDAPTPTTMTAEEAALRLDAAIPEWRKACDYDDERSVGPLLSIFWDLCIKYIAMRVAAYSPQQERLVKLTRELFVLTNAPIPQPDKPYWRASMYGSFIDALRMYWHPSRNDYTTKQFNGYINLSAYIAGLFSWGIIGDIMWPFASFEVLERDWEGHSSAVYCEVLVAVLWFEHAGGKIFDIFERGIRALNERDLRVVTSHREVFKGSRTLSLTRWAYWWIKFDKFARRRDLPRAVRNHARAATQAMNEMFAHDEKCEEHPIEPDQVLEEYTGPSIRVRLVIDTPGQAS